MRAGFGLLGGENVPGKRGSVYSGSVVPAPMSENEVRIYDVFCTMLILSRSFFSGSNGLVDDSVLCTGVDRLLFTDSWTCRERLLFSGSGGGSSSSVTGD